jgi:hypothetical protein
MMIDEYLNEVASKRTTVNTTWILYNGLTSPSPLVLTNIPPEVISRIKVVCTSVSGHTDCIGTVRVNNGTHDEDLAVVCTTAKLGTDTVPANTLPTITPINLDCNILVTCVTITDYAIPQYTYTPFRCRWEEVSIMFVSTGGTWTQSLARVIAREDYLVGDYICRPGTTTANIIKQKSVVTDLDAVEQFIKYML